MFNRGLFIVLFIIRYLIAFLFVMTIKTTNNSARIHLTLEGKNISRKDINWIDLERIRLYELTK